MNAITAEVIRRVFPVMKQNNSKEIWGTAFTIRERGREFLITACHVADHSDIDEHTDKISLIIGRERKESIRIFEKLIHIDKEHDIIVCKAPKWMYQNRPELPQLTSDFEMNEGDGITLGQDVMWMGYPEGFSGGVILPDTYTPIAMVGKGILSGFKEPETKLIRDKKGRIRKGIFIEGRIDSGYSGGPVVYQSLKNPSKTTYVIGVISGTVGESKDNPSFILAGDLSKVMKKVHGKQSC